MQLPASWKCPHAECGEVNVWTAKFCRCGESQPSDDEQESAGEESDDDLFVGSKRGGPGPQKPAKAPKAAANASPSGGAQRVQDLNPDEQIDPDAAKGANSCSRSQLLTTDLMYAQKKVTGRHPLSVVGRCPLA